MEIELLKQGIHTSESKKKMKEGGKSVSLRSGVSNSVWLTSSFLWREMTSPRSLRKTSLRGWKGVRPRERMEALPQKEMSEDWMGRGEAGGESICNAEYGTNEIKTLCAIQGIVISLKHLLFSRHNNESIKNKIENGEDRIEAWGYPRKREIVARKKRLLSHGAASSLSELICMEMRSKRRRKQRRSRNRRVAMKRGRTI